MNNKKTIIGFVLIFVVLIVGAYVLYDKLSDKIGTQDITITRQNSKTQAPDFTVYDENGVAHKLSDYRGKPVILNFWASWCHPCKSEMPDFDEAYKNYFEEINFLMVNLTDGYAETVESASAFIKESGFTFPVYYDTSSEAAYAYNTSSIPATYFIDSDGALVTHNIGYLSVEALKNRIEMLLELK